MNLENCEDEIIPQIKLNKLYDYNNIISIWKNIDNSTNSELELIFSIITFEIWLKNLKLFFNCKSRNIKFMLIEIY